MTPHLYEDSDFVNEDETLVHWRRDHGCARRRRGRVVALLGGWLATVAALARRRDD